MPALVFSIENIVYVHPGTEHFADLEFNACTEIRPWCKYPAYISFSQEVAAAECIEICLQQYLLNCPPAQ